MGIERLPRQTEGISTDRFYCLYKTWISDELPNGNQQEMEHFSHGSKNSFPSLTVFSVNRDVVCQLPPEARHPPYFAARL